jgi:hypothetical protein
MNEENAKKYEAYLIHEIAENHRLMTDRFSSVQDEARSQYTAYKEALAEFRKLIR